MYFNDYHFYNHYIKTMIYGISDINNGNWFWCGLIFLIELNEIIIDKHAGYIHININFFNIMIGSKDSQNSIIDSYSSIVDTSYWISTWLGIE